MKWRSEVMKGWSYVIRLWSGAEDGWSDECIKWWSDRMKGGSDDDVLKWWKSDDDVVKWWNNMMMWCSDVMT